MDDDITGTSFDDDPFTSPFTSNVTSRQNARNIDESDSVRNEVQKSNASNMSRENMKKTPSAPPSTPINNQTPADYSRKFDAESLFSSREDSAKFSRKTASNYDANNFDPFAGLWPNETKNKTESPSSSSRHAKRDKNSGNQSDPLSALIQETKNTSKNVKSDDDDGFDNLLDFLGAGNKNDERKIEASSDENRPMKGQLAVKPPKTENKTKFDFFDDQNDDVERAPLFDDSEIFETPQNSYNEWNDESKDLDPLGNASLSKKKSFPGNAPLSPESGSTHSKSSKISKGRGGIDLEEARRRTSLLTGGYNTNKNEAKKTTETRSMPASSQRALRDEYSLPPTIGPSISKPVDGSNQRYLGATTSGGTYFNDELLRQRQGNIPISNGFNSNNTSDFYEGGENVSGWDTGAILGRAGNMVNAAKSGAKSLLQKANGYSSTNYYGDSDFVSGSDKSSASKTFDVVFGEGRLGFTLLKAKDGSGVVCRVQTGSTAASMGVQSGDVLISVNKRRMSSYDEIMSLLPTISRPVLVTFMKSAEGPNEPNRPNYGPAISIPGYGGWDKTSSAAYGSSGWNVNQGDDWRVGSQDLQFKRPDFHGVVIRAFDGVFSWSLYGTTDGTETIGTPLARSETYTEYVMRCQWGPDPQNMSPWMVARRYREFDALDKDLREVFPHLRDSFPSLPPKELFKTSAEVVARRKVGLEQYMSFLIGNCPDVLCCSQMDRFLGICDRIAAIKGVGGSVMPRQGDLGSKMLSSGIYRDQSFEQLPPKTASNVQNAPLNVVASGGSSLVGTGYLLNIMSSSEAFDLMQARAQTLRTLNRQGLGSIEAAVKSLEERLNEWTLRDNRADPLLDPELHGLAELLQQMWPALKATASRVEETSEGLDLLPRVIQCDEDVERVLSALSKLCKASLSRSSTGVHPTAVKMSNIA